MRVACSVLFLSVCFAVSPAVETQRPRVTEASAAIDGLLADWYREQGLEATRPTSDDRFARRVYLDAIGRIPTVAEFEAFKRQRGSRRRANLITKLLRDPARVHHRFHFWADLLRVRSDLQQRHEGTPYVAYVKESLHANTPYDEFVRQLLTAEGKSWTADGGATGFWLRDAGMPEDRLATTAQVFLGLGLRCAQCHDHPTEDLSRHQFYALLSFTHGTRSGLVDGQALRDLRSAIGGAGLSPMARLQLGNIARVAHQGVRQGRSELRLPTDYQYGDAQPGAVVEAAVPYGRLAGAGGSQRHRFAAWLTSPENQRFNRIIVNRLWHELTGESFFDPFNELGSATPIRMPALLAHLEGLVVACGFDLRLLEEIIMNTAFYQGRTCSEADKGLFLGPRLRRLSAEQVWDSILTLIVPDIDERENAVTARTLDNFAEWAVGDASSLIAAAQQQGDDAAQIEELLAEFKELGERLGRASRNEEKMSIINKMRRVKARYDGLQERQMAVSGQFFADFRGQEDRSLRWEIYSTQFMRAAELPSPAEPTHLLRAFGQSDRELIDNGSQQGTVTQVLSLMNGYADSELHNRRSLLSRQLRRKRRSGDKVTHLFRAILARDPYTVELGRFARHIDRYDEDGVADLIWTLINSHEFLFIP